MSFDPDQMRLVDQVVFHDTIGGTSGWVRRNRHGKWLWECGGCDGVSILAAGDLTEVLAEFVEHLGDCKEFRSGKGPAT